MVYIFSPTCLLAFSFFVLLFVCVCVCVVCVCVKDLLLQILRTLGLLNAITKFRIVAMFIIIYLHNYVSDATRRFCDLLP